MTKFTKGVLTLIGGLSVHLMIGSNYAWGNIFPYLISYFWQSNKSLVVQDGYYIMPIAIFFSSLFFTLGGFLEAKYGPRLIIFVSTLLIVFGYFVAYLAKSLFLIYVGLGLSGIGIGLTYSAPLRTSWKYFPNNKGFVTGIIVFGFGSSALVINQIVTWYINPNNEGRLIDGINDKYYSAEISNRVPGFFLVLILLFSVLGTLGTILTIPYVEEDDTEPLVHVYTVQGSEKDKVSTNDTEHHSYNQNETLTNVLMSKDFWLCFSMGICTLFFLFMIPNINKNFGNLMGHSEDYLSILCKVFPIVNGFSRVLAGPLMDYFSFKVLYIILNMIVITISSTIYYIAKNATLYFLYNVLAAICLGSNFAIFPTFVTKKFGLKIASEIYGIIFFGFGIGSLLGPIISTIFVKQLNDYLIIFFIASGFSLFSMILTFILNMSPFDYNRKKFEFS